MDGANEKLYHHGIMGMKWGVRRYQNADGSYTSAGRSRYGKKGNKAKALSKQPERKSVKDMTDEELQDTIRRIELERKYESLIPQEKSKGKAIAETLKNDILIPAAKDVAKQLVKSAITKAINENVNLGDDYKIYTNNKKKG